MSTRRDLGLTFSFFLYQNLGFKDWFRIILQYSVWMFIAIYHWAMLSIWDLMGESYGIMGRCSACHVFLGGRELKQPFWREPVEELGDEYTSPIDPTGISPVIKTMAANRLTFAGWSEYNMVVQLFLKSPIKVATQNGSQMRYADRWWWV